MRFGWQDSSMLALGYHRLLWGSIFSGSLPVHLDSLSRSSSQSAAGGAGSRPHVSKASDGGRPSKTSGLGPGPSALDRLLAQLRAEV